VLDWFAAAARAASDGVVVVVPAADADREGGVAGGATRSDSVRAGLAQVPAEATIVCVHDGARPFADMHVFQLVVDAVAGGADGAIPGIALTDTIKQVAADGAVVHTPNRAEMMAVQTPQAFRAGVLRAAHLADSTATDDAALVEATGGRVVVVAGDPANRKITDTDDLTWARRRVQEGADMQERPGGQEQPGGPLPAFRVGQGFDIHRFSDDPARPLVLGGVVFEGSAVARPQRRRRRGPPVTDALLGAAGLGDIGEHFPTPTRSGKGPIRCNCYVMRWPSCAKRVPGG
jgi:2-C-methyl-D-erythritol 4-phosphate cytidylyltransferase